ncbi:HigA family addiction module antitoxin [Gluconobacter kondonii]|uniref:Transcriptional regulator n=1 Tax=Gluconobacter kondonii TaxID=941463 RepID=A0ABQ5WV89_9PROT|nr:HigA family addiction module antitoxin [Gluconobacter kondonii]MCP1238050.1 HigA family addiction module antitoxin [Gluconobacter kondonii]GBR35436.1 plasmid maintenance system antidote protein [Gluconobacter kondonii NBRC 3266]GLQ66894.1 transcriptional regulator [Gluconobacter kondonii]
MALKMHSSLAVHVGDWIRTELLEPHNIRVNDVAEHFAVSRQAISALLNGRASLSADMAIRFEKAFGVRAETLMRMQSTFDLAQAREHEGDLKVRLFFTPAQHAVGYQVA